MSYYTKYRPQTIAELDLVQARDALLRILSSGSFSHAYLFSGSKGTGKTSSARILAKVLNCDMNRKALSSSGENKLVEPCNKCDSCMRITSGNSLAVMEMDAASNRGIDEIRMLKERIGLTPVEGLFTVYIIDEVHMLTAEAFNALLKTLEEPPAHAVFILCTTDPQKIPDTVISRCTRIMFHKATAAEIVGSLAKAVKGEKLEISDGGLEAIARGVDGSFRDGMKMLEQMAQQATQITESLVDKTMGYGGDYEVEDLIKALMNKDVHTALKAIQSKQELGVDVGIYAKRLIERLRGDLLTSIHAGSVSGELLMLTDKLSTTAIQIKQSVLPWLPLEITVAEWCLNINNAGENIKSQITNDKPISNISAQPKTVSKSKIESIERELVVEKKKEIKPEKKKDAFGGTIADVAAKWQEILVALRPLNHSLEALLRSARPAEYEDGWLTIEAFYKFHKEQLEQERYRQKLEEAVGGVLGGSVYLKFVLGNSIKRVDKRVDNISGTVEDEALVKAAEEIFG